MPKQCQKTSNVLIAVAQAMEMLGNQLTAVMCEELRENDENPTMQQLETIKRVKGHLYNIRAECYDKAQEFYDENWDYE